VSTPSAVEPAKLCRVCIVGLGLMGGSLGLALRRGGLAARIVGCGRRELIERGCALGAIDEGSPSAAEAVAGCELIVLCTPVEASIRLMAEIAPQLAPNALITDVGSTKLAFAESARSIFGEEAATRVLPGHPLAGRELSGLEHASADLYDNCLWLLTPLAAELSAAQHGLQAVLQEIGARTVICAPAEHDRTLAYTSHLPQMLSTALALTLEHSFGQQNPALELHAGGLLSMLRLASSDPIMWEQIAASNRQNIAEALEAFESELRALRESLGEPEFRKRFEEARTLAGKLRS
jgi:prephenate dehydrogenase